MRKYFSIIYSFTRLGIIATFTLISLSVPIYGFSEGFTSKDTNIRINKIALTEVSNRNTASVIYLGMQVYTELQSQVVELLPSVITYSNSVTDNKSHKESEDRRIFNDIINNIVKAFHKDGLQWFLYFIYGLLCGSGILSRSKYEANKQQKR